MSILSLGWIRRHKWLLLLLGITALLVISPIEDIFDKQDNLISPLTAIVFLAISLGAAETARTAWCMALLTIVWLVTSIVTDGSGLFAGVSVAAPMLFLLLLISTFILLVRWMIRAVYIDTEVLCAAICGYLLIGILWTGFYAAVLTAFPGEPVFASDIKVKLGDLLYFSYTTLTTTGFGDITPRNPVARMFTVMEAIVGIFYNTIVIARFVTLYGIRPSGPGAPSN